MGKDRKGRIPTRSGIMTREEIEADFKRHSKKEPHSQAAMLRTYELNRTTVPSDREKANEKRRFKKSNQKIRIETDRELRNYARKDPYLAARIRQEDTMQNLYENRIRKEAWKNKAGIFLSIAFSIPFFLHIGKGHMSMTTDLLFAAAFAGIILFGPLRKYNTAIKGVILTFLTFFVIFISPYWETGHKIANNEGIKADSFFHLLMVTPLKYMLISVMVASIFIVYEKISSSASTIYNPGGR
ncbi:MAG: hypothetical protein OEV42_16660 [Deltaproteobacteria bacterium]|nr:hypothetical protein [Deltaproteobacteria bacterium]